MPVYALWEVSLSEALFPPLKQGALATWFCLARFFPLNMRLYALLPSWVRDVLLARSVTKVVAEFVTMEQFVEDIGGWIQILSSEFEDTEVKLKERRLEELFIPPG